MESIEKAVLRCDKVTAPLPVYNHANIHNGVVYVSGVQGFIPQTFDFPSTQPADQARQVCINLRAILRDAGSDLQHCLKLNLYLTNMAHFPQVNPIIDEFFPSNSPARSTVEVSKLPRDALVVIDAVAYVPRQQHAAQTAASTPAALPYNVDLFNRLSVEALKLKLSRISSSKRWVNEMVSRRPFASAEALLRAAAHIWWNICTPQDKVEAFNGRPLIGDLDASHEDLWSRQEDDVTLQADAQVVKDMLFSRNAEYTKRFGYEWILLCEGMSIQQQAANFVRRVENDEETEMHENSVEELKITLRRLRLALQDKDPYDKQHGSKL
eukprot:GILK01001374.1.p1 GENE.GILK01001374.1~~GILK01001374.1.p1  ORF type:complete len:325 (-),score=65.63 GILK01001374.1:145-1119(-)